MAQDNNAVPDLAGAEQYVEAGGRHVAGGRWFILQGSNRVIYQRSNGQFELRPVVDAASLRSSPTWRRLPDLHR